MYVNASKLYKWVDKNGNISYQDQPPPENARILSEKVIDEDEAKKDSAKTPKQSGKNLPKVTVYTVDNCELCDQLISILRIEKVPHIVLPLADDRDVQSKILAKTGKIITPSIFVGSNLIQGGTEEGLKEKLRAAGFNIEQ